MTNFLEQIPRNLFLYIGVAIFVLNYLKGASQFMTPLHGQGTGPDPSDAQ